MRPHRCSERWSWRGLALLAGLALCGPAQAHDTWLAWRSGGAGLALGTGHAYPRMTSAVPARLVAEAACRAPGEPARPLTPHRQARDALWLGADGLPARGTLSCWARTRPQTITLNAREVAAYLDEVHAAPALRAAWAEQQAAGRPWRELYSKHARLERLAVADGAAAPDAGPAAGPAGMPLELVLDGAAPRAGQALALRAWRDGQPAAGLALQLLHEAAPTGLWLRSDDAGRVQLPRLPLAGTWLVRGTDLRPPAGPDGAWEGRFVTLAFEAAER